MLSNGRHECLVFIFFLFLFLKSVFHFDHLDSSSNVCVLETDQLASNPPQPSQETQLDFGPNLSCSGNPQPALLRKRVADEVIVQPVLCLI